MKKTELHLKEDELACAHCGGEYLHLLRVQTYARDAEDRVNGLYNELEWNARGAEVKVGTDAGCGNPSGRRNGARLVFICESCEGRSHFTFGEFKGRIEVAFTTKQ